jgi:hypothetical protein
MVDKTIWEPHDIRRFCAAKLVSVEVSAHFQAILGCLFAEDWTTPWLVDMQLTPDGHLLRRCEGQVSFSVFLGPPKTRFATSMEWLRSPAWMGTRPAS